MVDDARSWCAWPEAGGLTNVDHVSAFRDETLHGPGLFKGAISEIVLQEHRRLLGNRRIDRRTTNAPNCVLRLDSVGVVRRRIGAESATYDLEHYAIWIGQAQNGLTEFLRWSDGLQPELQRPRHPEANAGGIDG
ncbi:hypothetical protein ACVWYH_010506 [Bradyrhizobium sp. GM24.11]